MERLNAASSTWWFVMTVYSGLCAYWNDASPGVPQWLDTPRSTKTTQADTLACHGPHVGGIADLQSRGNVVEMFSWEAKGLKRVRSAEGNDHNCRTQTMLLRTSNDFEKRTFGLPKVAPNMTQKAPWRTSENKKTLQHQLGRKNNEFV